MAEALIEAYSQPSIKDRLSELWQQHGRKVRAIGAGTLLTIGLSACDPDGPQGSLPDIEIDMAAAPFRAASTSEPQTDAERWRAAEQAFNIEKFINYRRMLDAMHKFAASRGHVLNDPGWFFEKYETVEKLTGVPKEILMGVQGVETTWDRNACSGANYDGPMQMGRREFDTYSRRYSFADDRGAPNRCSVDWSLLAAGAYLEALGVRDGDIVATERGLSAYNSGSPTAAMGYAHKVIDIARQGGLGY